jgi:VanZ family protein
VTTTRRTTRSKLLLYLAFFCAFVIVYASLQPFTGWLESTQGTFAFLTNFTRHITRSDIAFNTIAYIPLGFALYAICLQSWGGRLRWVFVFTLAITLSIAVEALQTWLPTRVSSIYDTFANALGAGIGALIATPLVNQRGLVDWFERQRNAHFVGGATGDFKILLLAVWLLVQINPGIPLFAATFHPGMDTAFDPVVVAVELAQTGAALIGIGLFTDLAMRKRWLGGVALVVVISTAIALKTFAAQWILTPIAWETWLRPGHTLGIALGAFVLMLLFWLPRLAKSIIAGIALLSSILIPLLLPDLFTARAPVSQFNWSYGQLLNLNGLTRTIALIWPFVATAVLFLRFGTEGSDRETSEHARKDEVLP